MGCDRLYFRGDRFLEVESPDDFCEGGSGRLVAARSTSENADATNGPVWRVDRLGFALLLKFF